MLVWGRIMGHVQTAKRELHAKGQSFLVQIKFRQNNCWQGTIHWLEGHKKHSFRSSLEMIMLINEALEKTEPTVKEQALRSWEQSEQETSAARSALPDKVG